MSREEPLAMGMGVLKFLLGSYILIISSITYLAYKDYKAEELSGIEADQEDDYTVLSYNGRTFVMKSSTYDAYINSKYEDTVLVDELGQTSGIEHINKKDIQVLTVCPSFDEAVSYTNSLNESTLGK